MNNQTGQAFNLDIMLALIIIVIIIGITADAIDTASYRSSEYSARFSLERVTNDAADMLIKTPGSPNNWELIKNRTITPGLAEVSPETGEIILNALSMEKITILSKNYNSLMYGKILPPGTNSSLIIYPSNPSLSPIEVIKNEPKNAVELAVANRTIIFNIIDIKAVIFNDVHKKANYELICPIFIHSDTLYNQNRWDCQNLYLTANDMNSKDYYLITNSPNTNYNHSYWILDRPEKAIYGSEVKFSPNPININKRISYLLGNDNKGVLWFHVKNPRDNKRNFDAYIISVPKGTNQRYVNLNSVFPEPWFLVLQVWYK
jgi:hypothetical protein